MNWVFWYYRKYKAVERWVEQLPGRVFADPAVGIFVCVLPMLFSLATYQSILKVSPFLNELVWNRYGRPDAGVVPWAVICVAISIFYLWLCSLFDPQNKD